MINKNISEFKDLDDYVNTMFKESKSPDRRSILHYFKDFMKIGNLDNGILEIFPDVIKDRNIVSAIQCEILNKIFESNLSVIRINRCTPLRDGSVSIDVEACLDCYRNDFYSIRYDLDILHEICFDCMNVEESDFHHKLLDMKFISEKCINVVEDYIREFIIDYSIVKESYKLNIPLEEFEPYIDAVNKLTKDDLKLDNVRFSDIKYICNYS